MMLALVVLLSFGLPALARAGADTDTTATCRPGSAPITRTELIFGTQRPRLPPITQTAWKKFIAREIAPRFPNGFTLIDAQGGWRGRRGPIREAAHILIVWHRATLQQQDEFEALRSIYKMRFRQESVVRIDASDCVSF